MTDKKPRGLAALSPERRREIQSMGGKSSPANFKYRTPAQRAAAGKKGGEKSRVTKLDQKQPVGL